MKEYRTDWGFKTSVFQQNFIANDLSAIAAYCFFEKKPAIEVNFINGMQLDIFWFYIEPTLFVSNLAKILFFP